MGSQPSFAAALTSFAVPKPRAGFCCCAPAGLSAVKLVVGTLGAVALGVHRDLMAREALRGALGVSSKAAAAAASATVAAAAKAAPTTAAAAAAEAPEALRSLIAGQLLRRPLSRLMVLPIPEAERGPLRHAMKLLLPVSGVQRSGWALMGMQPLLPASLPSGGTQKYVGQVPRPFSCKPDRQWPESGGADETLAGVEAAFRYYCGLLEYTWHCCMLYVCGGHMQMNKYKLTLG